MRSFECFSSDFLTTLHSVESDHNRNKNSEMRTFEESAKSKKTVASMIENKENNTADKGLKVSLL